MFKFSNRNVLIVLIVCAIVALAILIWGRYYVNLKSLEPVLLQERSFEIIEVEDLNIEMIRKYYFEIAKGNLENAYNMYQNKNVSFETYEEWYKDIITINPIDFEKLTDNRYQFKVELQDNNQKQKLYHVVMEVDGQKIIPISSKEIVAGPISFENVTAFITQKQVGIYSFKTYLMLSKNGKYQVLDDELSFDGAGKRFFGPLEFSPDGNYLISPIAGYEWRGANIYDVKNKKRVLELSIPLITNFTSNEKYFFACALNELGGEYYAKIYSVPDFEEIYDLSIREGQYNISVDCGYNEDEHIIRLRVDSESRTEGPEVKIVEFSEITGKIEVISD